MIYFHIEINNVMFYKEFEIILVALGIRVNHARKGVVF